jgi:hypothetical protein
LILTNDEDIFSEDYGKGKKEPEPEKKDPKYRDFIEKTPKPESKSEVKKEEKKPRPELIKPTVGRAKVVGISVISVVIAVIVIMATGVIELDIPESLITLPTTSETQLSDERKAIEQGSGNEPFKEVSSASDMVDLELNNGIAGYFMVSSCCNWYGDFVDFNKVPKKIEQAGNAQVNFVCFNDEHLETQTYFGTFKNVLDPFLSIDVYINGKQVQSKTTTSGSALIVEGSCLGNES